MKQKTFNCFRKGKRDVRAGTAKSKSAKKDTHIALINFPRSGMEHFVRSSYPGLSRKTLRNLKRQRAGRIADLTGDKNIPTYVLPLRGFIFEFYFKLKQLARGRDGFPIQRRHMRIYL